jgi:DNA-directed RNA polymerase specialized sigma subunit
VALIISMETYASLIKYAHFEIKDTPTISNYVKHGLRFQSKADFDSWIIDKQLCPHEKKLLEAIYFSNLSMNKLGKKLGVSRQFIHKKHLEIIGKLDKLNGQNHQV